MLTYFITLKLLFSAESQQVSSFFVKTICISFSAMLAFNHLASSGLKGKS